MKNVCFVLIFKRGEFANNSSGRVNIVVQTFRIKSVIQAKCIGKIHYTFLILTRQYSSLELKL